MSGLWSRLKKLMSFNQRSDQVPTRVTEASPDSRSNASPPSFSSRFSRSLSSAVRSSKTTCAICLGSVKTGHGHAIFTAECSHSFHFSCIADSVRHGNHLCPICRAEWNEIPIQQTGLGDRAQPIRARVSPYQPPPEDFTTNFSRPLRPRIVFGPEPTSYADDEPLLASSNQTPLPPRSNVSIKAFTEFPAVAASDSISEFAVLVSVRAPPLLDNGRHVERAPVDLVAVLDVSGSMTGPKLSLLKRAVCFVIDNLGPADRLSVVTFSSSARRILSLRRMSNKGRDDAKAAVDALCADGETDIVQGLKKGAKVLEERREKNPVASIILLSDGRDSYDTPYDFNHQNQSSTNQTLASKYLDMLPVSVRRVHRDLQSDDSRPIFSVHTFGFGGDHDSATLHAVSDESGGTFSFIETIETVQDAFARCIGGLLSVTAQNLCLNLESASPGVKIVSVPSGKYRSEITNDGLRAAINVGDLYADEEKQFLTYLSVPEFEGELQELEKSQLLKITCSYHDTAAKSTTQLDETASINRPKTITPSDSAVSLEVDSQRNRLLVARAIKEAQQIAETGDLTHAQLALTNCKTALILSASAQADDGLCKWLQAELSELIDRMANMQTYEQTGRAYALSGLNSHSWQRATTRGDSTMFSGVLMGDGGYSTGPVGFNTPSMVSMVSKSQTLSGVLYTREQQIGNGNKSPATTTMQGKGFIF